MDRNEGDSNLVSLSERRRIHNYQVNQKQKTPEIRLEELEESVVRLVRALEDLHHRLREQEKVLQHLLSKLGR